MTRRRVAAWVFASGMVGCEVLAFLWPRPVMAASAQPAVSAAQLFEQKGCAHCHGANRMGTSRGPKVIDLKRSLPDLERQIREGGKSMPAFGDSLSSGEIESLARYVQHKRKWWF